MSSQKPTVAIIGISGSLGPALLTALTSDSLFRSKYSMPVHALGRNVAKYEANNDIRYFDTGELDVEEIKKALKGVDVLIDALNVAVDRTNLITAASQSNLKLVFPGFYGHELMKSQYSALFAPMNIPDYWRKLDVKVTELRTGFFMKWFVDNLPHIDLEKGEAQISGAGDEPITFTFEEDISYALASLGHRPVAELPDVVRIGGEIGSYGNYIDAIERATKKKFVRKYKARDVALAEAKEVMNVAPSEAGPTQVFTALSIAHFEDGVAKFEKYDNEWVNPGVWEWSTIQSVADRFIR